MNPQLSITVDLNSRRAQVSGIIAVGETVDVRVSGLGEANIPDYADGDTLTGPSLRLRIVTPDGCDLVRYPLADGDEWELQSGAYCAEVKLDSAELARLFRCMPYDGRIDLGVILDSTVDEIQYANGRIKVVQWSKSSDEDLMSLPNWRETLIRIKDGLAAVTDAQTSASESAQRASEASERASASAIRASESEARAQQILRDIESKSDKIAKLDDITFLSETDEMKALPTQRELAEYVKKLWGCLGGKIKT